MNLNQKSSIAIKALLALIIFQGVSGVLGGISLVYDPTGSLIRLPLHLLDGTPFNTYFIPGLILLTVLGVFPLFVGYGLWQRLRWSWTGALLTALALMIWIGVEILIIGYHSDPPLQFIYGLTGLTLFILVWMPTVVEIRE